MVHNPIDERYRKPRRLGNTELSKHIRTLSLAITSIYAVAMYIGWRRNLGSVDEEEYKKINFDDPIFENYNNVKRQFNEFMQYWNNKKAVPEAIQEKTDK